MALPLMQDAEMTDMGPDESLAPGTRLMAGQYRIERFLNSGSFALIYLVRDSLGRTLVVKECFPADLCRRSGEMVVEQNPNQDHTLDRLVGLFLQEARTLAELDHPGIIRVHQVFEENNTAYMVMDYVDGPDLLDVIDGSEQPLAPAAVERLLIKVLSAVAHLHNNGVLHRDLSPDNIMIGRDGSPILIDFGASRGELRPNLRAKGSLRVVKDGYSPQELYAKDGIQDEASDFYCLAATFYHLITGTMPTAAPLRQSALEAGFEDPFVPLVTIASGYPLELLETVDQALSLDPARRPESAQAWLNVLSPVRKAVARDQVSRSFQVVATALISCIGAGVVFTDPARSSQLALTLVEGAAAALADPVEYTSLYAAITPAITLEEADVPVLVPLDDPQFGFVEPAVMGPLPSDTRGQVTALSVPVFPTITLPADPVPAASPLSMRLGLSLSTDPRAIGRGVFDPQLDLEIEQ